MSKTARKHAVAAHGALRIIGGQWKRTSLPVLAADGLRPTPDRVRETVFNWLTHLIDGHWERLTCLDVFAGSGALGFEAASRGARRVVMFEHHRPAVHQLAASKEKLQAHQVEIHHGDALVLLQEFSARAKFDLIFADPPYHQNWLDKIMPACLQLLVPHGFVYVESEQALEGMGWMASWEIVRADKAGRVFYHLLRPCQFRHNAPSDCLVGEEKP